MLGGTGYRAGNTAGVGWLTADGCVCAGLYAKRTNTEGFCGHNGTEISDGGGRLDGDRSGKQRHLPGCPQINAGSSCLRPDLQIVGRLSSGMASTGSSSSLPQNLTYVTAIFTGIDRPLQNTRQSDRCNGGVFPAILNLPLLDSFVPSSHRPDHRRYPRRAFAMISCAPSGD